MRGNYRAKDFDCAYYSFLSTKLVVEQLKIIMVVCIEFIHGCFKLDIRLLIRTHSNITVF